MKLCPSLAALLLAGLGTSCKLASPMPHDVVWNVDMELQVVSLPEALAMPLAVELRDPHRSEGAFKDLQKLIAEKRAILVGWPFLTTISGQRAVVEQIDELRYGTEWDVPGSSTTTTVPDPADPTKPAAPKTITTSVSDGFPTAMETRNIGVTFEAEPVVAPDGEMIQLNMVPQHVHFLKWERVFIEKDPPGVKIGTDQPRFITNKLTTSMTFHNGERKLVGFFKVPEPAGNVELFILRVDALKKKVAVDRPAFVTKLSPNAPNAPAPAGE